MHAASAFAAEKGELGIGATHSLSIETISLLSGPETLRIQNFCFCWLLRFISYSVYRPDASWKRAYALSTGGEFSGNVAQLLFAIKRKMNCKNTIYCILYIIDCIARCCPFNAKSRGYVVDFPPPPLKSSKPL